MNSGLGAPVRAAPDKALLDWVAVAAPAFLSRCVYSLRYRRPVTVRFSNITRPLLKNPHPHTSGVVAHRAGIGYYNTFLLSMRRQGQVRDLITATGS